MRRYGTHLITLLAAALTLTACAPDTGASPQPPGALDAIPTAFTGTWGASAKDCGQETSTLRVRVAPQRIEYYESIAQVQSVERLQGDVIRLDLAFTGEGQTWEKALTLTLADSGQALTFDGPDNAITRTRCDSG